MTIEHKLIPDGDLHEPKGVATALGNTVYVANGVGSGTWKKTDSTSLKGLNGDGGIVGLKTLSDGTNGFTQSLDEAYGSMTITGNTNGFGVTAAVDSTLNTNSDYVLFTGTGAPWLSENLFNMTFGTNAITVPVKGVYEIQLWSNVTSFPTNTAKVSAKYRVNGTAFSSRHPIVKSNSAGDAGQLTGFGLIALNAGDFIQLYIASSATGSLIISDANTELKLIRQVP